MLDTPRTPMSDQPSGSDETTPPAIDAQPAAPATTPLPPTEGAGYNPYGAGYGAVPPPYTQWTPQPPAPQRPRRNWRIALMALALLVALGVGGVAGAALVLRSGGGTTGSGSTRTLGASSAPSVNVSTNITALQKDVEAVAKAAQPSVVEITSSSATQNGESIGSGDILTKDGYIVTNDHVVQGFDTFTVTFANGSNAAARLVGADPQDDLAVLKVAATNLTPIALGDSSKLTVGQFNVALGSPLGQRNTATFGIVSALNRSVSEAPSGPATTLTGMIQTSAPFNPGNSGGALLDLQGQLIGIPTLSASNPETGGAANSIGYAIPVNRVEYVTQQLIAHGSLTSSGQGFIGIQAQNVTPQLAAANGLSAQSGVLVVAFSNDAAGQSPAQQAGLRVGDVITAVNGQTVNDNSDLAGALLAEAPGSRVTLTILRGSAQSTITVTLGERPVNAG